jgi:hypothetical protein
MHSKRMKDALCHRGNMSLAGRIEDDDFRSVDDEYCHAHSAQLRVAAKASEKQSGDRAFLEEFVNFVRREDLKVLPAIEAILATGTQGEAADWLGLTKSGFGRMRNRLSQLAECFLSGAPVPKQRRPYMKRTAKDQSGLGLKTGCLKLDDYRKELLPCLGSI